MREHNYPVQFYEYVRTTLHNMFADNEAEQTIEDVIRNYMRGEISEEPVKKEININSFKFLSK
jgi:hypothetical protein